MKQLVCNLICLCSGLAFGAYSNATLNITACGGTMSGGGYTSIGSLIPVGGNDSQSASYYNYSGFAAGFILQPETAFSGLADEWNPDNDLDGLLDGEEIIAGSCLYNSDTDGDGLSDYDEVKIYGTSPILADTDGDGMTDAHELIAGTSPTDGDCALSVICTLLSNGQMKLSWFGVQGRAYTFQYRDSLDSGNWQSHPFGISGQGAAISLIDAEVASNRFYRVKVRIAD